MACAGGAAGAPRAERRRAAPQPPEGDGSAGGCRAAQSEVSAGSEPRELAALTSPSSAADYATARTVAAGGERAGAFMSAGALTVRPRAGGGQ
jgi:hypothetical protein